MQILGVTLPAPINMTVPIFYEGECGDRRGTVVRLLFCRVAVYPCGLDPGNNQPVATSYTCVQIILSIVKPNTS